MKRKKLIIGACAMAFGLLIAAPALPLPDAGDGTVITAYAAQTLGKCTAKLSNTADGIKVSWNKVSGADSYAIYRKAGSGSYSKVAEAEGTSWVDTTAAGGTSYTYYVQPVSGSDTGSYVAATITRLENVKPSLLNTASGVKVSWSKVSGADSYAVYRKESGGSYECIGETTSRTFTDTTAASGTKYNYYVRSYSGDDKSGYSSSAILRLDNPVLSVSNKNAGMKLSWDAVAGADSYNVYRKADGESGYTLIASTEDTAYTDSTAQAGVLYRYYVRAVSGSYQSGYSSKQLRRLEGVTVTVYNASSGVKLSWGEGTAAESYKVYRKVYGGSSYSLIAETEDLSYVDGTAASGTKYTYCVRVANGSDLSSYTKKNITFLAAPETTLSNTSSGLKVSWDKVSGAESYRVFRKAGSGSYAQVAETTGTSWTDTDTEGGTTYRYYVRAIKASQQSGYASQQAVRLENVTLNASNSYQGVKLSWTESTGAESYKVYRKVSGDSSYTLVTETEDLSYIDTTAESGVRYNYCVRAANGTSLSGYSSKAITYVAAPLVTLTNTSSGITVAWNAVSGADRYVVYRKVSGGSYAAVAELTGTTWTDTDVEDGVTYRYYVKAYSGTRASGYTSAEISYVDLEGMAACYTVVDGKVVDLVSGTEMSGATVDGEYFSGGTVQLPSSYTAASIETVMVYNRESTETAIGSGLSYYGGAFLFLEVSDISSAGLVKVPFGGGQTGTNFRLHASINSDNPVLGGGESYWCLAFDADSSSYALQINDDYYEKSHWSNYINRSFTLSSEHQFKTFIVYTEKLTEEEMMEHYEKTGISTLSEDTTLIGRITDGITGLGSALAFTKTGSDGIPEWLDTETESGSYSVDDGNGFLLEYNILDYVEPDNDVDNSSYESVHIINAPETLYEDYKYALSAVPYPFNVNHDGESDQYDISWSSSDESVALVIDGLIIPQGTGEVTITSTLAGTDMTDSCTITIEEKEETEDIAWYVPESYVSPDGDTFSDTDYEETTRAIYAAIDEAYENGYNHIIFPETDFYAAPTGETYYIPTGMTVEFPEGSAFHMMPTELAEEDGYTYFRMGWDWYDYHIPTEKASVEYASDGSILGYSCQDAHLIIDQYYGEFYDEDATTAELASAAHDYAWGCTLLDIGRDAEYCTVEVHEAQCPTGFFLLLGGKVGSQALENGGSGGSIKGTDFVSGWLDDEGNLVEDDNWISTTEFFEAESGTYGTDPLHSYFLGDWEENVTTATNRLYDILWYDENYELIEACRWQYTDEKYTKPEGAVYFKVSIQQSELPDTDSEYLRIHPDASSRFCEIRNTNVINGADGLASVVGATDSCWIHDNYVSNDGYISGWSLDLEDGWLGMRGTIIENNIFRKYTYSLSVGDYTGKDTGVLQLACGYNTFVISNYLGAVAQSNGNVTDTHIINNVVHTMYSAISGYPYTSTDIRAKIWAHVYYNIIGDSSIAEITGANGKVYHYGNSYGTAVNYW